MAKHVLNFADKNLLEQVITPEVLIPLSPKMADYMEGLENYKAMHSEISTLGTFVKKYGFTPGRDFQHVARIPSPVRAALLQVMPDALTDKKLFYALLEGPLKAYDIRGKLVI